MSGAKTFEVRVACSTGTGPQHEHVLEIAAAGVTPVAAREARQCELQYTCPLSGKALKAIFDCPAGFDRPYRVVRVS